ncbi:uncharacterized protein [Nicotiana tomentosiformis]|uniref:uncharacterized protein n=1 Tax=Nicotiana tomentosiformis TaxID=4098 RepID=UPI00388C81BE
MKQEVKALEDNKTWSRVDLPKGKNTMGSQWVYKLSTSPMEKLRDLRPENSAELVEHAKTILDQQFRVNDLGEIKYFLGIEVLRSKAGILLNQRKYILELISELRLSGAKLAFTPLEANVRLTTAEYDQANGKELGVQVNSPVITFSDSTSTIHIEENLILHERTNHIEIDCHFIRDKIKEGVVKAVHANTKDQQADLLTKGLGTAQHMNLLGKLGVLNFLHSPA